MKQLALIWLILLPLVGVGQNPWPAADSEWSFLYDWGWPPPNSHYSRFYVNGTETIQGTSCTKIFNDVVNFGNYMQGSAPIEYLHFDGDTLWHYVGSDSSFYPLICFNALPGDSWHPMPFDSSHVDTACTVMPIEVLDTFTFNYNGQDYRGVDIGFQQSDAHLYWGGSFNERTYMSPTSTILSGHPFPWYNACGDIIVEWYWYDLLCYRDSELSIEHDYVSNYPNEPYCEYPWNLIRVNEPDNGVLFAIYPNPTASHIRIQLPENNLKATRTRVFDMTGRLVHQQPFNPNMDVSHLDSGTYIVVVETEEGNFRGTIQKH